MLIPLLTAIHVVTVVLWIGGVAFVTVIIFPILLRMEGSFEMVMFFQKVEKGFARQAKAYVWIAGITGGLLLYLKGMHTLLFRRETLGITIMLAAWLLYLFVLTFEKGIFKKLFSRPEKLDMKKVFTGLSVFHRVILGLSLLAVFAGVWQGHS